LRMGIGRGARRGVDIVGRKLGRRFRIHQGGGRAGAVDGAKDAAGADVLCELGINPVIAATPIRLTSMTATAAPATSG
jgi:hypothetical protein